MTVLEVGPATVRLLAPCGAARPDSELVAQALAAIDDTTVLLDERPVTVESLWRNIMASAVGDRREPITVLHPSWWSPRRIARVVDAAASTDAEVTALPRSSQILASQSGCPAVVVEVSDEVVAVCRGTGSPRVFTRPVDPAVIAAEATGADTATRILIDAPQGVQDAEELGRAIRAALERSTVSVHSVQLPDEAASLDVEVPPVVPARHSRVPAQIAAALVVGLVVCCVGMAPRRPADAISAAGAASVRLVEGRVSVRVPAGWPVARITAGPGSRRVEITSPAERTAALHVTQAYAPEETMTAAAEVLHRALGREPAGLFVDFNPADERAGRPAVTYREVRAGRVIRWSVIRDGSTRISIGCQSDPRQQAAIDAACDEAIRSAGEVGGTGQRP